MDSNLHSSLPEDGGTKAAFRKPSNDATSRKYRRRSPVSGSSSADGSPGRDRSNSPIPSRGAHAKVLDNRRRKDDERDFDRDHDKSQYGRTGDSYRHHDRQSSRSHNYHKNEDYVRHDKHAKEDQINSSKSSPRMRGGSHSDYMRWESEQNKSKDHLHNVEKYSRDRSDGSGFKSRDKIRESSHEYQKYQDRDSSDRVGSGRRQTNFHTEDFKPGDRDIHKRDGDGRDGKRDYRKTSKDHRSDRSPSLEESRGHRLDVLSRRDSSGHTLKESSRRDFKELDGAKYSKEEKDKDYRRETDRRKERHPREEGELVEEGAALPNDDDVSTTKKPKLFSLDKGKDLGKDAVKHTTMADKVQSASSKESIDKVNKEQEFVKDSDIDAAKVAAMKAAELVNRNLIGTGYMSTDQKKKLLWGSKKAAATEEPTTHHWDASLFSDRERQEKFKKLMGVKGEVKVDHKPEDLEKVQLDLEKQYTAGLRRRDGRTVGLGL